VWAGTFHAAAYAQLRRHWADNDIRPPTVLDDPARLMRRVLRAHGPVTSDVVAAVAAEVQWAQARTVSPDAYPDAAGAAGRRTTIPVGRIAKAYTGYVEAKRHHALIDLNDLITCCSDLLERDATAAAAWRWRIRHLFVDEFQDVNPAQWRLLGTWLQGRGDLFVVGDPCQAVYGWNGADPSLLERLPQLLPGTTVLRLDTNHRSSPQVIAAARAVLQGEAARRGPPAGTDTPTDDDLGDAGPGGSRPGGDRPGDDIHGGPPDGPEPTVSGFDDDFAEATAVVRWLRLMHRPGRGWSHLAVLARTNARLEPVIAALRSAGIPFRTGSGDRDRGDLHETLTLLRREAPGRSLRSALADVWAQDDEANGPRRRVRNASRPVLARLADEHALDVPGGTVGEFLSWLAAAVGEAAGTDLGAGADSVDVSTFHRSKGLEWPAVALIGLEDGLVPISYATSAEARSEERRLLYVAVSRAEEDLWCSWALRRDTSGGSRACRPSPMLASVAAAGRPDELSGTLPTFAERISSLRTRLSAVG
jgi:DNA helicase-2/ATP-dependent DNA helicase PcrA